MPGIRNFLRRMKRNRMMKRISPYVRLSDDSFFTNSFNVDIRFPAEGQVYLRVGSQCVIEGNFVFEKNTVRGGGITIGDRVYIGSSTFIASNEIIIEDDVVIAWGCLIYDHNSHSLDWRDRRNDIAEVYSSLKNSINPLQNKNWSTVKSSPIKICKRSWLGTGVTVLKGVTIGEGAVVGAGSVVVKDVEPYTVVGGNPARFLKKIQ